MSPGYPLSRACPANQTTCLRAFLACAAMSLRRRRALPEPISNMTPEESHEEAPPQVTEMPVGGFDQFADALWSSFQQRFMQQHSEQS